ncbi:MAG: sodium:solute symporter family transporter, partial [Anaerotruncus massiliensis (ex Togo et al. 2019)]
IISKDLIQHAMKSRGKQISDKDDIFLSRVGILLCTVFSIGLSLWFQGIMELMDVVMSICAAALVIPYLFAWFSKKMNTEGAITGMVAGVWRPSSGPSRQTPRARCHLDRPALLPGRVPGRAEVRQGAHAGGDRRHLLFPGEIPQPPPRGKGRVLTRSRGRCVEGICFASNWERSRSLQCF